MSLSPPDVDRCWTVADLRELPHDGRRYELVDGNLAVTPPSSQVHQDIASDLRDALRDEAPAGWRTRVEYLLPLAHDHVRVPDVVVFRWPLEHPRDDPRNPLGPADVGLVVEVVSPRSRRTDRFAKPAEYAAAGIALYWRVETEPELVLHAFELRGGGYQPVPHRLVVPVPWGSLRLPSLPAGWP